MNQKNNRVYRRDVSHCRLRSNRAVFAGQLENCAFRLIVQNTALIPPLQFHIHYDMFGRIGRPPLKFLLGVGLVGLVGCVVTFSS